MKSFIKKPAVQQPAKPVAKKVATTSWGGVADWYTDLLSQEGTYQKEVILPNLLRLIDVRKGITVADVGCGNGFFSRALAEKGAVVTGVDIAPELITKARELAPKTITYAIHSADAMTSVPSVAFDVAICILALQNIQNAVGALQECARILKPGGRLFLVLNHPAFRIPAQSAWGWDEEKQVQYRRLDRYLSESKVPMQMHPGSDPSAVTWSFHRPLQFYFKLLQKQGFMVERLEEWTSHTKTPHGPRKDAENRSRVEFPLFLCLEARHLDKKSLFV